MNRTIKIILAVVCFIVAGISLAAFFGAFSATIAPACATGASISTAGYLSLLGSIMSALGFSAGGIISAIAAYFQATPTADKVSKMQMRPELTELIASFAALVKDLTSRSAQRRFVFALVDCAILIPGCTTHHEGESVTITYTGFVDPVAPAEAVAK